MKYEFVSITTTSKASICGTCETAVTRETLRRACERFSTQFCDYVELYIAFDIKHDLHKSIKYDVTDDNRDAVYFTIMRNLADIFIMWD